MADEEDRTVDPEIAALLGDAPLPAPETEKPARKARKAADDTEERLHPILSNEDVLKARAKARARIDEDRRAAAMADIEAREVSRLRREEGLTSGIGVMDEIVNVTIDLPPFADRISINGPLGYHYWHGKSYDVPRHVANDLSWQMMTMRRHEDQTEGRSLVQTYQRKRDTSINARTGTVANAPRYNA